MSSKAKILVLFAVIIAGGFGLVLWKGKSGGHGGALTKVTKEEMEMLVKDLNPMQQRMLAESPDQKKELAKNLQEFLAIASQARKEGYANKPEVKEELEYMHKAILALSYDKVKNKDKPMPPLSMITEAQVAEFWGEDPAKAAEKKQGEVPPGGMPPQQPQQPQGQQPPADQPQPEPKEDAKETEAPDAKPSQLVIASSAESEGFFASLMEKIGLGSVSQAAKVRRHEAEFKKFLDAQKKLETERGQRPAGVEMSPEQVQQMRDSFARFSIYAEEAESKMDELGEEFAKKVEFQTKIQQSQLLAQLYARDKLVPQLEVTEKDIEKYIADHPELVKEKKAKADEVLKKAKDGGDFAELAKEFSEDPGSKENGGLYENVPMGQMVPAFEKAAVALQPGQIAPELVKTKFGYHIIKLEKKGKTKGADGKEVDSYDARHILISTTYKDPSNPMQQEMPLDAYVDGLLKKEKQEKILAEILKNNPIEVASDFTVEAPPMPQQPQLPPGAQMPPQQQQPPAGGDEKSVEAPKEEPKPESGDAKEDKK
ncbi:MAG: peptidylprolyl isomerase [Pyrinomonadaceae bacterium]